MLHLISSLYASLFNEVEFNVLIVGREASGKSTLLEQIKYMYSPSNPPTTDAPAGRNNPTHSSATASSRGLQDLNESLRTSLSHTAARNGEEGGRQAAAERSPTVPSGPGSAVQKAKANADGPQENSSRPRQPLPPGTPVPASADYLDKRRIRPTVGMNYAKITHYFAPLAASVETTPMAASSPSPTTTPSGGASAQLPPVPTSAPSAVPLYAAPTASRTQLTFWDLGGQPTLRPLWRSYFSQCHAIVFVVDASAHFAGSAETTGRGTSCAETHATDSQLLLRLLSDPLLNHVPMLIFCNKCDEAHHLSLAAMQDALDLVDIAVQAPFYAQADTPQRTDSASGSAKTEVIAPASGPPASHQARTVMETAFSGAGGFGNRLVRLVSGSARTGDGVAAGLDWLVAQLLREARTLPTEDVK